MRLAFFSLKDVQEISTSAGRAFISTFGYTSDESDDLNTNSDSDLSDFDPSDYGCGEISEIVEDFVYYYSQNCNPLEQIYLDTTGSLIKETIRTASEESQCAGLKFFGDMTPGEDRDLITSCISVCYWCCCKTIQRVSPIIAQATINLLD